MSIFFHPCPNVDTIVVTLWSSTYWADLAPMIGIHTTFPWYRFFNSVRSLSFSSVRRENFFKQINTEYHFHNCHSEIRRQRLLIEKKVDEIKKTKNVQNYVAATHREPQFRRELLQGKRKEGVLKTCGSYPQVMGREPCHMNHPIDTLDCQNVDIRHLNKGNFKNNIHPSSSWFCLFTFWRNCEWCLARVHSLWYTQSILLQINLCHKYLLFGRQIFDHVCHYMIGIIQTGWIGQTINVIDKS